MKDAGWVPSRWTVLRFGATPDIVQQVVIAKRTHFALKPAAAQPMELRFPPRTWVVDTVTARQYLVRDDLSEYNIGEPYSKQRAMFYRYKDLLARVEGPGAGERALAFVQWVSLSLMRQRGLLIALALSAGIAVFVFTRRSRGHGSETQS
jgi:hypothetical protein